MTRLLILLFVFMIFVSLADFKDFLQEWRETYEQERIEREKGWTPRSIPVCDKELWERIEDGCLNTEGSG